MSPSATGKAHLAFYLRSRWENVVRRGSRMNRKRNQRDLTGAGLAYPRQDPKLPLQFLLSPTPPATLLSSSSVSFMPAFSMRPFFSSFVSAFSTCFLRSPVSTIASSSTRHSVSYIYSYTKKKRIWQHNSIHQNHYSQMVP